MSFLLLDLSAETLERVRLAFQFRWPHAQFLIGSLEDAVAMLESHSPELIALEARRPLPPVVATVRKIRERWEVPLIILHNPPVVLDDELAVLEAGADDYVAVSSPVFEIVARLVVAMRRIWRQAPNGEVLEAGPVVLNRQTYEVFLKQTSVKLTPTEFRVLELLLLNKDRVVLHGSLERALWGDHEDSGSLARKYIHRLRRKLQDDGLIVTVHGIGYRFVSSPNSESSTTREATLVPLMSPSVQSRSNGVPSAGPFKSTA